MQKIDEIIVASKQLKRLGGLKRHPLFGELVAATNFLPEDCSVKRRLWHATEQLGVPTCKVCNNGAVWDSRGYYRPYCSNQCATSDPARAQKIQSTNLNRYGSVSPFGSDDVHAKSRKTVRERYGVDNISQDPDVASRKRKTLFKKLNPNSSNTALVSQLIEQGLSQQQIGTHLGISQPRVSKLLHNLELQVNKSNSTVETEVLDFVRSLYTGRILSNDRKLLVSHEIDILLPDKGLAFEINGVFWHSEISGKSKNYHLNKTLACADQGIQLIQILDSEWLYKRDVVQSRIKSLLGMSTRIHGRQCVVELLPSHIANDFVDCNHLQGRRPARFNYGLFFRDDLVAVMTLSCRDGVYEIIRFCNKIDHTVVGGATKIFSRFVSDHSPKIVKSFADRRWSEGALYKALGFSFTHNTKPNYWYFARNGNTTLLMSRLVFQKHKLHKELASVDPAKTEWENMRSNGYDRIWDCGSSSWELKLARD